MVSATPPVAGVLALQGGVREHADVLAALGAQVRSVRRPRDLVGLDALIMPGGESTAIARLARSSDLLGEIAQAVDGGLAVLGTCAGLILLAREVVDAEALAGFATVSRLDVSVRRNAYGAQAASGERDVTLADGTLARASFIRAPLIERVGDGVDVLARDGEQPVAVRQGHIVACSFHPELTGETRLHRMVLDAARGDGAAVT